MHFVHLTEIVVIRCYSLAISTVFTLATAETKNTDRVEYENQR